MEQNIQLNCEIVRDLLPLYHDKVVSEATETAVENHLDICSECLQEYKKINTELPETKSAKVKADVGRIFKKIKTKAFLKGALITCLIAAVIIGGYFSLFKLKISTIPAEDITIEHAYKTEDGIFLMYSMARSDGVDLYVEKNSNSLELVFKEAVFNEIDERNTSDYFDYVIKDCQSLKISGKNIEFETENIPEYITEYLSYSADTTSSKQITGMGYCDGFEFQLFFSDGTEKVWNFDGTLEYEGPARYADN